jgi:GNAT superfamily N-acetyltransferase
MKKSDDEKITVTSRKEALDMEVVMEFMNRHSYWAKDRDRDTMRKAIDNSLCFSIFCGSEMAGFARAVTDYATMYYLCDVFIRPDMQGKGLGKKLIQAVLDSPELKGLYGILLTRDAHELYKKFGFSNEPEALERFMIKRDWSY